MSHENYVTLPFFNGTGVNQKQLQKHREQGQPKLFQGKIRPMPYEEWTDDFDIFWKKETTSPHALVSWTLAMPFWIMQCTVKLLQHGLQLETGLNRHVAKNNVYSSNQDS